MDDLARRIYARFGDRASRRGFMGAATRALAGLAALAAGIDLAAPHDTQASSFGWGSSGSGSDSGGSGGGGSGGGGGSTGLKCCSGTPCAKQVCPARNIVGYTWYCCASGSSSKVKCSDCFTVSRHGVMQYQCTFAQTTTLGGCH
jgi:hypothetical protein